MNSTVNYKMMSEPVMEQYCIYWDPADYPQKYVVRRWAIGKDCNPVPDQECKVFAGLSEARNAIPGGFARIGRDENDDKSIVEVWI